jgi:hypothetical protein
MKSPQKSPNYFRAPLESGSAGWDRTNDRPINSRMNRGAKPADYLAILLNNNPEYTGGNPQFTVRPVLKSPKSPQLNSGNTPLSAKTGITTMRLESLLLPPAYRHGYFCYRGAYRAGAALIPTAWYYKLHRIMGHVCSLGRRAFGRCGNPLLGKDTRRSYPVLKYGTGNAGQHIFRRDKARPTGLLPQTVSQKLECLISLLKPSLNAPYLGQHGCKLSLTWSHPCDPSTRRRSNGHAHA